MSDIQRFLFAGALLAITLMSTACGADAVSDAVPEPADVSINGIHLCDPISARLVLGSESFPVDENECSGYPCVEVSNKSRTELLQLFQYFGDVRSSFCKIRVAVNDHKSEKMYRSLELSSFVTGKGIRLGMSLENVVDRLGDGYTRDGRDRDTRIVYIINDMDKSDFLRRFNLPSYRGEYSFRNSRLVEFTFGFDYP